MGAIVKNKVAHFYGQWCRMLPCETFYLHGTNNANIEKEI